MVEVLGKDPSEYKKVTCKSCASELRYTLCEVIRSKSYDYTGDFDYVYHIQCPCCGSKVNVRRGL